GLTLRNGNREYFYQKLEKHFPGLKERYIKTYGNSYEINSPNNKELMELFHQTCKKHQIVSDVNALFSYLHQYEDKQYEQLMLKL
ncbi:radical SAM protein, partial [Lachnotalea glycerini]